MNRVLLAIVTLGLSLAPIFCSVAEPTADQAKAIAEIERLGGKVTIDEKSPGKPVIGVNLTRTRVTDAGLEHLAGMTELRDLNLNFTNLTGSGLEHLKGMTKLRRLELGWTKVTDASLAYLKRLANLKELELRDTSITDSGWPC